ncbi:hypothetical protein C0991_000482 [Blastosporella zonata]|nr:hypothetical protein C0991_000482 [Blastosporella zonata]
MMSLLVDPEDPPPLLTLACRFVSYDQWFTTHVDPDWKVKQVKSWILSKCLGISFHHPSNNSRALPLDALATSQQVTPSGQRYRPASPITFAPDPRRRPISPILFAKGGKGKERKNKKGKGRAGIIGDDDIASSSVDGYEEDDEGYTVEDSASSFDESEIYRRSPPPPLPAPSPSGPPVVPAPVLPPSPTPFSGKWKFNASPTAYTLIRFSTGQVLEDDLALVWYDLSPHELLELHSHGDVCTIPKTGGSSSAPASSSHATTSEHGHNRNPSIYSLTAPPSPSRDARDLHKPIHVTHFNRSSLETYIQPYWEGPVRELRTIVPRLFTAPMPNFLNGYGYGYSGLEVDQRAMAIGIGHPPPFRGAGGWDAKVGAGAIGNGRPSDNIQWRPRHLVIKDGRMTLGVNREVGLAIDTKPRHIIPLAALISISGSDHIINYLRSTNQNQTPAAGAGASASAQTSSSYPSTHPYLQRSSKHHHKSKPNPKFNSTLPLSHLSQLQSRQSTTTIGPSFPSHSSAPNFDSEPDIGTSSHAHPTRNRTRVSSIVDDGDITPKEVGGELIEELRIVCLRYKSVERLKRVVSFDRDGLNVVRYVPEKEGEKERVRERQREEVGTSGGAAKKKKGKDKDKDKEDGKLKKGKGKGFPWGDGKEKETGKGGKKEKEKRDWFSGKKDKDKGGLNLGGMGMTVSLGLGLSGGVQDTKERMAREWERGRDWERDLAAFVVSGGEDGASDAWSEPVFAQDSTDAGSDEYWSDIGGTSGKAADGYRYGYRYGYQGLGASERGRAEPESVHEEEDRLEKERTNLERRKQKELEKKREEERRSENEKTEYIILELGCDIAYTSFLRILHRHLSPGTTTPTPTSTPTPTPTPTPFPSPLSSHPSGSNTQAFQWFPSSDEETPLPTHDGASSDFSHITPVSPSSRSNSFDHETHPSSLTTLTHTGKGVLKTFGALPYPEWRAELTGRAQRAGMGNIGRAMNWVKWGRTDQLALDVEELLRRHGGSDEASAESIRKKKKEVSSLKNRRRSTTSTMTKGSANAHRDGPSDTASGMIYDSDVSEDTGKLLEMSDSEEGSDAEWYAWQADLSRQRVVQKRSRQEAAQRALADLASPAASEGEFDDDVFPMSADAVEDLTRRALLEPKAVITARHSEGTDFTPSTTLYSPSSSESLNRRGTSFSPVDRSSSPAGAAYSHNSHAPSQSTSPLHNPPNRKHNLPAGFSLSHSASMNAPALRSDANIEEQNLRRPSMPTLTPDKTLSLYQRPAIGQQSSSILRSPILSNFAFPTSQRDNSTHLSPTFSAYPVEEEPPKASSSVHPPLEPSPPITILPRRSSTAGLMNSGGLSVSLSRSTSVLTRSGLLKKDMAKEAERLREKDKRKEEKAKEKEDKAREKERAKDLEREAKEARKLLRPKLSLATSSTHQLVPQPATSIARSDASRSFMRKVKSGSNLNEVLAMDEATTIDGSSAPRVAKKKRFGVNRFVTSAIDFADGR